MTTTDVVEIARRLIACDSVTPAGPAVFDLAASLLSERGFAIHRSIDGEAPDGPVENMIAIRRAPGRHFAFAGHLDVVPPGEGWTSAPFAPEIRGGLLHGRGAVDMKGAIAAFIAALDDIPADAGTINLLLTGDEEGPGVHGTREIIKHLERMDAIPDLILVGEPTSSKRLGDTIKIGRRGSVNMWITVDGVQGHVAYPQLANNPIPRLIDIAHQIDQIVLDNGSEWFDPSNIEFTDITVGNPATNVIPARATARLSIRFNDHHVGEALVKRIRSIVEAGGGTVRAAIAGEAFLTPPGPFSDLIADAIRAETGITPALSTTGGTSDARFLHRIAPTVEFGLVNATMHKLDEAVAVEDLAVLRRIYAQVVRAGLGG